MAKWLSKYEGKSIWKTEKYSENKKRIPGAVWEGLTDT